MSKLSIMREMFEYLRMSRKYWMLPVIIILFLFSALMVLSQSSAVAPLIYTLF